MKRCVFAFFFVCSIQALFAVDFGAVLDGEFSAETAGETGETGETGISGKALLSPWLSVPLGEADFYVSAGLIADFTEKASFIPELLQLEFSWRVSPSLMLRAGRIPWMDPSGFTAWGRMDGADVIVDLGKVRLGAAAFYTGFMYRETAEINFSPGDPNDYNADFDWADFGNTYFAPRRVLTALYGEFPGLPFKRGHLYAGILAQFDLSRAEERFHTQYLLLRHSLDYKQLDFNAAGAVELEHTQKGGSRAAYAVSLEGGWRIPGSFNNRLSQGMRWASGEGDQTAAFFPVVMKSQGLVLEPNLSGIMLIQANFEARLLPSLSAQLGGRYFLRTDSVSFSDPDIEKKSYALGAEIDASLLWVPLSDISFSIEGGVFLPNTGTAMREGAPVRWSLVMGTIFSF